MAGLQAVQDEFAQRANVSDQMSRMYITGLDVAMKKRMTLIAEVPLHAHAPAQVISSDTWHDDPCSRLASPRSMQGPPCMRHVVEKRTFLHDTCLYGRCSTRQSKSVMKTTGGA